MILQWDKDILNMDISKSLSRTFKNHALSERDARPFIFHLHYRFKPNESFDKN